MPWYWTDDMARVLVEEGSIDETVAAMMALNPVAIRSEEETLEAAGASLLEDDEIPLAA